MRGLLAAAALPGVETVQTEQTGGCLVAPLPSSLLHALLVVNWLTELIGSAKAFVWQQSLVVVGGCRNQWLKPQWPGAN